MFQDPVFFVQTDCDPGMNEFFSLTSLGDLLLTLLKILLLLFGSQLSLSFRGEILFLFTFLFQTFLFQFLGTFLLCPLSNVLGSLLSRLCNLGLDLRKG
jgi:hypothetical protein